MENAGAILTIDLDAIVGNYARLRDRAPGAECAAVVKADAYGLGIGRVAPALAAAGCRVFFVALPDEGVALRSALAEAEIHVLGGAPAGAEADFAEHRLIPTLNSLGDIEAWSRFAARRGQALAAAIHLDTGMSRLGLSPEEAARLAGEPERLANLEVKGVMSHLACAETPDHPLNAEQLARFTRLRPSLPEAVTSFANSSGIFLGVDYHFDLVRPGAALYGVNPHPGAPNPMAQVLRLQGKILQVRDVDSPQTVGYGALHRVAGPARLATVAVGYADGYPRSLGGSGAAYVGDVRAPVVGRVSMDLITLDVSRVPESDAVPGALVDLIGPRMTIDDLAERAGTISYEILTSLGARYHRAYKGGGASRADTDGNGR